jgi:hypothetical protein
MPPAWAFMISWATIFIGLFIWYILEVIKKNSVTIYELRLFLSSMLLNVLWLLVT